MSSSNPNRRLHEDGGSAIGSGSGSGSGNQNQPAAVKHPHEDQVMHGVVGGKAISSSRHDYHTSYEMAPESRASNIFPRNDSRESDWRYAVPPNSLYRVPMTSDLPPETLSADSRMALRDINDGAKDIKLEAGDLKSGPRGAQKTANSVRHESKTEEYKDMKRERDYSCLKCYNDYIMKTYPDHPSGNSETWNKSCTCSHVSVGAVKEGLHAEGRELSEAREAVGENRVENKGDEKLRDKDRRRKEAKPWEWREGDKERSDILRGERYSESSVSDRKDLQKDKEKLNEKEKEKDHVKKEPRNASDREASHNEKELGEISGKYVEPEKLYLEPKKKDHDMCMNLDKEVKDKKKERDDDIETERSEKRGKFPEKESDSGGLHVEGSVEREREVFNSGIAQRKRMLRPRSSPQRGNRDSRFRPVANDTEGPQNKADASYVYKTGGCMQDLIKLWKEYEQSQVDKACEISQNGPTVEIRIPAENVTATNRHVRGGQLWGTDMYTVDSDMVAVLMHTGYCRPTASPPPSAAQELHATIRLLPPQECYISTLRNNVRSRSWGSAIDCSYQVERCCILKKGGGIIDLEPCLTLSSTMEPTLAPMAVERTMTTRAAASNALRQQKFVREVTIQFNLCMEPWLKYSISSVADKGLKKSLFTSARLKKGEVLYAETHTKRYELSFNGEKVTKTVAAPHPQATETGKTHPVDGESTVVDVFRWSLCKRPLPQKYMLSLGIPLPTEHVEVLEENLEWEDICWSQSGVWIGGKEYHLARTHFLAPN